jgi:hypothetical protein
MLEILVELAIFWTPDCGFISERTSADSSRRLLGSIVVSVSCEAGLPVALRCAEFAKPLTSDTHASSSTAHGKTGQHLRRKVRLITTSSARLLRSNHYKPIPVTIRFVTILIDLLRFR